ncbi:MAG TPA: rRNA maturation RNase YbeY [Dissulfurispiraceae bacterium]|nr:rRNA maturation RNase YbeY [Dissulfurispiraceae bacterium]
MVVAIRNRQRALKLRTEAITAFVEAVVRSVIYRNMRHRLPGVNRLPVEVSVVFSGDRMMRKLNKEYRAKDTTTDVLSFPQFDDPLSAFSCLAEGEVATIPLGDIVVSVPQGMRQAGQAGVDPSEELARLLIHGILHLFGYDHERSLAEERMMRRIESGLLRKTPRDPLCWS